MNKEFKKALSTTARQLNMQEKEVFDEIIKLSLFSLYTHFNTPMNVQYDLILVNPAILGFDMKMAGTQFMALAELQALFQDIVQTAEPFADVVTEFYEIEFLERKNKLDQYMTPAKLSNLVAQMLMGDKPDTKPANILEPCCGTGSLVLAGIRQRLKTGGKEAVSKTGVFINDIDPVLLRISVYQILFHSFHHNTPVKFLNVQNVDMRALEFGVDQAVLACHLKEPMDREMAMMKAIAFYVSNQTEG